MDDQSIRNRLVRKLVRQNVVGGHKKQLNAVVDQSLPTHERGRGKQLLVEMVTDHDAPVEAYGGGHRRNVRLTSLDEAVEYLRDNDGDVPFGWR